MEIAAPAELIRRCQRTLPDDTRAFESLVTCCKGPVFATAYRLMGDWADAEDVSQEVFIKLYHHIKRLGDPAAFPAWLYRTVTNACLDALDKRRRRAKTTSLTPDPLPHGEDVEPGDRYADTHSPTPEDSAISLELRRCLEATLARLDKVERAAIVLRDVEDRPYEEIAGILAVGLSAVKMRIHRARLAFRNLLQKICPDLWPEVRTG